MKRFLILIVFFSLSYHSFSQFKFKYGITAGLNVSSAIIPELDINTDINAILHGDDVIRGNPNVADFVTLYKGGLFFKLEAPIVSARLNVVYDKTQIHKSVDASVFSVDALNVNLSYIDFDMIFNVNLSKHFYISAGYVPAILINHEGNLNINDFDQRLLTGIGFKFANGMMFDLNAIAGISEVIDGSYIHNLMIPITLSIPLN